MCQFQQDAVGVVLIDRRRRLSRWHETRVAALRLRARSSISASTLRS
jgi:hypothetical protein